MRLYICIDGSFAGTQSEANAKGKGWTQVEVPTDKGGLLDYLNGMVDEARGLTADRAADMAFGHVPAAERAPNPTAGATVIADWYQDHASATDVCDLFLSLSSRFNEALKEIRVRRQAQPLPPA